jgi:hypothetical protein
MADDRVYISGAVEEMFLWEAEERWSSRTATGSFCVQGTPFEV